MIQIHINLVNAHFIRQRPPGHGSMIVGVPVFNLGIVVGTGQSLNHIEPVAYSLGPATCSVVLTGIDVVSNDAWIAWAPQVFELWRCQPDHLDASRTTRGAHATTLVPTGEFRVASTMRITREPTNTKIRPQRWDNFNRAIICKNMGQTTVAYCLLGWRWIIKEKDLHPNH